MKIIEITDDAALTAASAELRASYTGTEAESDTGRRLESVCSIIDAVRARGDEAVAEFTAKFDGVSLAPDQFELNAEEIDAAVAKVPPSLVSILKRAHANIRIFHGKSLRESWEEVAEDGTILGQRITPIERAGVYVPGGKAFYPSSVLMNIVPASVARVKEIVMVSPPSYEGSIHPVVLAAARIAGATRIFRVGGAQAIAALAYGTGRIPSVLKITGPGNAYVALAKRLIRSVCDIDTEAGPSEVVVIADAKANPKFIAAEMLAQAEHDEDARSILVTTSREIAERTQGELERQAAELPRNEIIAKSLADHGMMIIVRSLKEAALVTDVIAPEHLSIQTEYPRKVLDTIHNAGAAMLGSMTPVAVGDYWAGPNHILPTGGRARFASPLTAEDFRKVTSIISYTHERILKDADAIARFARSEELTAHANAVEMRK